MTLTIWVYEKNGLCRGPGIFDAYFIYAHARIYGVTGPSPLSGLDPVYTFPYPRADRAEITLYVGAPRHEIWDFNVWDDETHEVWLSPR
jgi:hypothetical protein